MQVLTEELLLERAKQVIIAIFSVTEQILISLITDIDEIENASLTTQEQIRFLIACGLLFHASQFFRENIIQDEDIATNFIKRLKSGFEDVAETNPSVYLDLFQSSRNPIEHFGTLVVDILGLKSAILKGEIVLTYSSFLFHGYLDSLNRAWNYSLANRGISSDLGL